MDEGKRPCPLCRDLIDSKATVCPTCRRSLPDVEPKVSIFWTVIGGVFLLILWVVSNVYSNSSEVI